MILMKWAKYFWGEFFKSWGIASNRHIGTEAAKSGIEELKILRLLATGVVSKGPKDRDGIKQPVLVIERLFGYMFGISLEVTVMQIVTAKEVAALLSLKEDTVGRLASEGKLPGFKLGKSWRFDMGEVEKWIAGIPRGGLSMS